MKDAVKVLCIALVLVISVSAMARLRGDPRVEAIGIFDENPSHVAIVFEGGGGLVSSDNGLKWERAKKESLPAKLAPLPLTGHIRYQAAGLTVICSKDSGANWEDVSPFAFLRCELSREIEISKRKYKDRFSLWLPDFMLWPVPFSISAIIIVLTASILLSRQGEAWTLPMLLSLSTYFFIGLALWLGAFCCISSMCDWQWRTLMGGSWGGMAYPRWPLGILLLLCGGKFLAPLTAALCFPFTPLFHSKIMTHSPARKTLRLVWGLAALAFIVFIPIAVFGGRGDDYYDFP